MRDRGDCGMQLADILGMRLVCAGRRVVRGTMRWSCAATQSAGLIHGGALAALADSAGGVGTLNLAGPGTRAVTAELKMNFFANVKSGGVKVEARLVYRGKSSMVWESRIRNSRTGELLAIGLATYVLLSAGKKGGGK